MNPTAIILIGEILLKYGPIVAQQWQKIFSKEKPTDADWEAIWALTYKSYDQYVAPNPPIPT